MRPTSGRRRALRVVVDTNVFVAAYFNAGSAAAEVWRRIQAGELAPLWSKATRDEVLSVLRDVKVLPSHRAQVREVFRAEHQVSPSPLRVVAADPADDEFLACAVYGRADALITNDRHLLDLRSFRNVPVVTPGDFLSRFVGQGGR